MTSRRLRRLRHAPLHSSSSLLLSSLELSDTQVYEPEIRAFLAPPCGSLGLGGSGATPGGRGRAVRGSLYEFRPPWRQPRGKS